MQIDPQEQPHNRSPFKGFLPIFWLALACLGGILLGDAVKLPPWVWYVGVGLSFVLWLLPRTLSERPALTHHLRRWTRAEQRLPGAILAMVFFIGGGRYAAAQPMITPDHVAYYNDRGPVELIGTLVEPPDIRDNLVNLTVRVEGLRALDDEDSQGPLNPASGLVLVQVQPGESWAYGDKLQLYGQLEIPFEGADFSYRTYLERRGILSIMSYAHSVRLGSGGGNPVRAFLYRLRGLSYETLQALFPSPESDLLAGILLGLDHGLSPELATAFQRTGTTHIIAISGFNIAILAGLFSGVFTRLFGRKWGSLIAVFAIAGFTILVGGEAAVVRAAIMGSLGVMGGMFGRRQNGLNSLGLAALGMMLVHPNVPWDIGFQLSVAATLGLVLYAQPLEEWFVKLASQRMPEEGAHKLVGPVSEFLLFTLAAQVMTLPLIAYHFGGISWVALAANPLILPAQSLLLILGGLALLTGLVLPGLGKVMVILALPFVRYTIRMVNWLGRLPGGDISLPEFNVLWLILFYAVLFLLTLVPREGQRSLLGKVFSCQTGALLLAGLVVFVWNRVMTLPDDSLQLTLLDGEGTTLIQTPGGGAVLIGGGDSPSQLRQNLGQMLPAGDRMLDVLIVGSAAREDLNGVSGGLVQTPVEMTLWGIDPGVNQISRTVYASLLDQGTSITTMKAGQSLDLGEGILLRVLWTGERGAVLWLEWGDFSGVLPAGKVGDEWMSLPGVPDVLLLPDDISTDSFSLQQITDWSPSVILLPLEESDRPLQGLHAMSTLLGDYPLVSTLEHGWVRITTDREKLWVNGER